jgi:hypothetical protein
MIQSNISIGETRIGNIGKNNSTIWNMNITSDQKIKILFKISYPMNNCGIITVCLKNNKTKTKYEITQKKLVLDESINIVKGTFTIKISNTSIKPAKYILQINTIEQTTEQIIEQIIDQANKIKSKKYAIMIGISDYININDLSFCDEDIVSWADYLSEIGYEFVILGDISSSYGKYKVTDLATETNVRNQIKLISDKIVNGDKFLFVSSGHGSGDGKGNSFLCCVDEDYKPQGEYTDKEFASDIQVIVNKGATVISFFDNCFSGGMLEEVCACDSQKVCALSTCTEDGYGFDENIHQHGAWTYAFLIQTICKLNPKPKNLGEAYKKALEIYPYKRGNLPQIKGNINLMF